MKITKGQKIASGVVAGLLLVGVGAVGAAEVATAHPAPVAVSAARSGTSHTNTPVKVAPAANPAPVLTLSQKVTNLLSAEYAGAAVQINKLVSAANGSFYGVNYTVNGHGNLNAVVEVTNGSVANVTQYLQNNPNACPNGVLQFLGGAPEATPAHKSTNAVPAQSIKVQIANLLSRENQGATISINHLVSGTNDNGNFYGVSYTVDGKADVNAVVRVMANGSLANVTQLFQSDAAALPAGIAPYLSN